MDRARELSECDEAARPLLRGYARVLTLQRDCSERLHARLGELSGSLDRDLSVVRSYVPLVLSAADTIGPSLLAQQSRHLLDGGDAAVDSMLLAWWRTPSDEHFFARMLLQPYAACLARAGIRPADRESSRGDRVCPFCGGAPQVSVLQSAGDADGGGRQLQCSVCFTLWPFRRVLCAFCGEEDERRLGYFHSPSFDHVRVDTCDTCKGYLKTVDLTRLGLAVPVVDEVASASLDLWARDRGYQKIALNLVGL